MKTISKLFVMTMFVIAFASSAFAATKVETSDGTKVSVDGNDVKISSASKPVVKKATKKKVKGKRPVKKVVEVAQVAPAAISPSATLVADFNSKLDAPTAKAVSSTSSAAVSNTAITKTAKKSSSFKIHLDLFGIFMPDKVTTTALSDHLVLVAGLRAFNSTSTSDQPNGFKTVASDATSTSGDFAIAAKAWRIGAEYSPFPYVTDLATSYNGASLNGVEITTSNKILGKFYAIDGRDYGVSLGLGAEYTSLSGAVSMGGFRFETTGEGWTPVLQLGGEYHLNQWWTIAAVYERSNIRITTRIPGAPDLITTRPDRIILRLNLGLF